MQSIARRLPFTPALLLTTLASASPQGVTERVSVDSAGTQAGQDSYRPATSADGLQVAYFSAAEDLVAGDSNGAWDVFVRDRVADRTVRVSVGPGGLEGNNDCFNPSSSGRGVSLSQNGRFVAFHSRASNLVPVDTNYSWDCFVHDRDPDGNGTYDEGNGVTQLVSVDSNGNQYADTPSHYPWISANGRFVAFQSRGALHPSDSNGDYDIYVRDRKLGETWLVTRNVMGGAANGPSYHPVISGNGSYVAYESLATDLAGNDQNGLTDVFLTSWQNSATIRVSEAPGGVDADGWSSCPTIDHSGFHVAFSSHATNLTPLDGNGDVEDVFAFELVGGTLSPISVRPGGMTANDSSLHPSISPNGRWVAFESLATDMTPMESFHFRDVFVFDRTLGDMVWVSPAWIGSWVWPHADGRSRWPAISASPTVIAFESEATNLVLGDTNQAWDVFVRIRERFWRTPWI